MLQKKRNFFFATSIAGKDGFFQDNIPSAAYELENLNDKINKDIILKKVFLTKQIIHSRTKQIFQHWDLLKKSPDKCH